MLNFDLFITAQASGYPDFLIRFACVSHWAGKVLAEAAKSEIVHARTRKGVQSICIHYINHIFKIQFHIFWYFDIIHHNYTFFKKMQHQPMEPVEASNQWIGCHRSRNHAMTSLAGKKGWRFEDASCTWGCFWRVFIGLFPGFSQVFPWGTNRPLKIRPLEYKGVILYVDFI